MSIPWQKREIEKERTFDPYSFNFVVKVSPILKELRSKIPLRDKYKNLNRNYLNVPIIIETFVSRGSTGTEDWRLKEISRTQCTTEDYYFMQIEIAKDIQKAMHNWHFWTLKKKEELETHNYLYSKSMTKTQLGTSKLHLVIQRFLTEIFFCLPSPAWANTKFR